MGNFWLKIKIWTKIILGLALTIFALLFILNNRDKSISIWFWHDIDVSLLELLSFTVAFSVVATILIGTVFKTIRQVRELKERTKHAKLQSDLNDMHAKAAMLKTKPEEKS